MEKYTLTCPHDQYLNNKNECGICNPELNDRSNPGRVEIDRPNTGIADLHNTQCSECKQIRGSHDTSCSLYTGPRLDEDVAVVVARDPEAAIDAMAQALYQQSNRTFRPLFPWIFIRVLKKQQQVGSIILPDIDQNKTVAEGIVLATWQPFSEPRLRQCPIMDSPCEGIVVTTEKHSELKPGDHVLFPFWAGLPITGHKPEYYRVVKECDWAKDKEGGIFAKVEYDSKNTRPIEKLKNLVLPEGELAEKIDEQFLLVDRDGESVTLSGR